MEAPNLGDLTATDVTESSSFELLNAIDVEVFNIDAGFEIEISDLLDNGTPSQSIPAHEQDVGMYINPSCSSDVYETSSHTMPPEEENVESLKEKLKSDRETALQRNIQLKLDKKEKKRARDRVYQKKRYQKLKQLKNQNLSEETEDKSTHISDNHPVTKDIFPVTESTLEPKAFTALHNQSPSQPNSFFTKVLRNQSPSHLKSLTTTKSQSPQSKENIYGSFIEDITLGNQVNTDNSDTMKQKVPVNLAVKSPNEKTESSYNSVNMKKKEIEEKRLKNREKLKKWRAKTSDEKKNEMRSKDRKYRAEKRKAEKENPSRISYKEKKRLNKLNQRAKRWRDNKKREKISRLETVQDTIEVTATVLNNEEIETTQNNDNNIDKTNVKENEKKNSLTESKYKSLLKTAIQRADRYKKRLQRLKNHNSESPSKKIRQLAGGRKVPTPVKRRLHYLEVMESGLEKKRKEIKAQGQMENLIAFNKTVCSPELKKRRLLRDAKNLVTYKSFNKVYSEKEKKENARRLSSVTVHLIRKFYCQDNVSKMMPGKRDFKKVNKVKYQTRLLLGTIKELHRKYNKENPNNKVMSKETFRRLKPIWVKYPKLLDRNTCACMICSNIKSMHMKAIQNKIIVQNNIKELISASVCRATNKSCMLNRCQRCKDTFSIELNEEESEEIVTYKQWVHTKKVIGNNKEIKVVAKVEQSCNKKDFVKKFCAKLNVYKSHTYKITYQYEELKRVKESLRKNEALIHVDFSENYQCKGYEEPQSYHFGSSKSQLSLHTVLIYTNKSTKSVCTVSKNTIHKAYAVWAHLQAIFTILPTGIEVLHVQSDGPSSQYKNRFNMFFITTVATYLPTLKFLTWNYSVSGHGKGPADGVGGNVKRAADLRVKTGHDISDVSTFIKEVGEICEKIYLTEVSNETINMFEKLMPQTINPVANISKVQQVTWSAAEENVLYLRELSCFSCAYDTVCEHHCLARGKHTSLF